MRATSSACGVLLVAKAAGLTSHDVVDRIRATPVAAGAKVGHAGTLDPFATGLLLVLIGRATRFQRYFVALPKSYRTVARFGAVSDTGDPDGVVSQTGRTATAQAVRAQLASLTGHISQRVPMTSAVKVGGERLYRKARRGEQVETPVRQVHVTRFELVSFDEDAGHGELEVDCSSGTYVRTLMTDLGERCGTGAYCLELERTAIGQFTLEQADDARLIDLSEALSFLPARTLGADETRRVRNGVAVAAVDGPSGAEFVRLTEDGQLVAVAERSGDVLKPVTVVGGDQP